MSKNDTEGEKISKSHQEVVGAGGEYELVSSEGAVAAAEAHVAQALRLRISSLQREYAFFYIHLCSYNRQACLKGSTKEFMTGDLSAES